MLSILARSNRAPPDDAHDDDDGHELQQNANAHESLGRVRIAAAQHVEKSQHEDDRDGKNGERDEKIDETVHRVSISEEQGGAEGGANRHISARCTGKCEVVSCAAAAGRNNPARPGIASGRRACAAVRRECGAARSAAFARRPGLAPALARLAGARRAAERVVVALRCPPAGPLGSPDCPADRPACSPPC